MPKTYPIETIVRAEELYCMEGHSLEEVAARTEVSKRALQDWKQKHGWDEKRLEIRRALLGITTKTLLLRERLIDNCMTTMNARDVFALASLEAIARKQVCEDPAKPLMIPRNVSAGKETNGDDAVAELEKACHQWMYQMSADPGQISPPAIRALKAAMDLVRDLKKKSGGRGEERGGLSDEVADEIRRKILGIPPPDYNPNKPNKHNSPNNPEGPETPETPESRDEPDEPRGPREPREPEVYYTPRMSKRPWW